MRFRDIYDRVIECWPEEINIDDGYPAGGDGHYFPTLSKVMESAESRIGHEDPWLEMMVWTMFQVFHRQAVQSAEQGLAVLNTREVDRSQIEARYFDNLHGEDWSDLLADYERAIE